MPEASKSANWYDAFPAPRNTAPLLTRDVVLSKLSSPELLLIDVRRTDYEGGTIKGSLNLPAHSFYMNRGVLYDLCKRAGIQQVAFYCGSSNGRGPRCSGWFADYIADKSDAEIKSFTLKEGIKGWAKDSQDYTKNMDGYDAEYWKQFS